MTTPPKAKFQDNEKVLCYHGPLLYEAKCIKIQIKDKTVKYFIHYSGWNKNWDEWVPEDRVLKYNESNLLKQKELANAHIKTKKVKLTQKKAKDASTERTKRTPKAVEEPKQRSKKAKQESHVEPEENYHQKSEIKVKLPEELKLWLVDDWELVCNQKKLFRLPSRITVHKLLNDYADAKVVPKSTASKPHVELCEGLKDYFNLMLGTQLLYRFERIQYTEIMTKHPEKTAAQIYGPMHLLRMFARLGSMLAYTAIDEKYIQVIIGHVQDFLKYMVRATNILSLNDYEVATADYVKKSL